MPLPPLQLLNPIIDAAPDLEQLSQLRKSLTAMLTVSVNRNGPEGYALHAQWNEIQDRLISRAVRLAETELELQGRIAPCPYTFVLFGSGGRGEQCYASDQDNGILYDDPQPGREEEAADYFRRLGTEIQFALQSIGYPPCPGHVVCGNREWSLPISELLHKWQVWFANPAWEHVRYLLICADMRPIAGHTELAGKAMRRFHDTLKDHKPVIAAMLRNSMRHQPVLGLFGNLVKVPYGENAGGIEIKYAIYIPFINGIRFLSMMHGMAAASTMERIGLLHQAGVFAGHEAEKLREIFAVCLHLRNMTSKAHTPEGCWQSSGIIAADRLSKEVRHHIRTCVHEAKWLQQRVLAEYKSREKGAGST
ncbi:DUF294 nucleotidyltransferase-like domain-containing protein [Paenibacillus sp. MSJ-34]|uniref:DUF294 nucleotidyltransferase-like domain-containing protein n=1 Tax=Paenibacillus sp. MSJ-34 TaxID=2841529 RepID=UPI001C1163B4|nr:DUF294 nucleotidyltransferase-like domain-containing protein [Paenibacillus sp. MSJ-34]MBU5441994.1 hypothetical protein [Paenibacillus sp. MSJ-34]